MRVGEQRQSQESRLRLVAGCDPTTLALTPAEGYLLSRIDGHTSWNELRQMGALPPAEVDGCIERWLKEGVVEPVEAEGSGGAKKLPAGERAGAERDETSGAAAQSEAASGDSAPAPPRVLGGALSALPEVDESLDLSREIQEEVLAFAEGLGGAYHEILGVDADADEREIKKAYFQLSKRFHPDRYFRRQVGDFGPLIEVCFKRLLEAYELLSDPATRSEVQNAAATAGASGGGSKKPLSSIEARRRLRERVGQLSGHKRVMQDRKRRAKSFFESGMTAFREERWLEAAGSVRLAIAFDPSNAAYRESFADVQRRAHEERAKVLLKQAQGAFEMRDLADAYKLFDEAVHYRPFDAELAHRTADLAWTVGDDLRRARELAAQAAELEPDNALYRRTLGQIYQAAGMAANARRELEAALKLDPKDKEAKAALRRL